MIQKPGDRDSATTRSAQPFFFNELLLRPAQQVPLPLIVNPKNGFQAVVRDALVRFKAPGVTVEPMAVTIGSMLYGCQEFLAGAQDFLQSQDIEAVHAASARMLRACREFSGNIEGAYVIVQATESIRGDPPAAVDVPTLECARFKNFAACLEDFFGSGRFAVTMEVERQALLEVHLDEVFDECSRQLERFYHAAIHRGFPHLFGNFARDFYHDVFKRIMPDHIYDPVKGAPAGGADRSGLLDLIPELQEAISAAASAPDAAQSSDSTP